MQWECEDGSRNGAFVANGSVQYYCCQNPLYPPTLLPHKHLALMKALCTSAAVHLLFGCDASDRAASPQLPPADLAQMGTVRYASPAVDQPRTTEDMETSLAASTEGTSAVSQSGDRLESTEWREAARRFQAALSQLDGVALDRGRQIAGAAVIRVWLPNAPDTPEAREVAARFVGHLVTAQSPEAGIVLDGLARVGDHWTAEAKADAARSAADAAQPTIDREAVRAGARERTNRPSPEPIGERATLSDLERAQADLRALAAAE